MVRFVARRVAQAMLVVLASTFVVFVLVSVSADPLAQLRLVPGASEQSIGRIIEDKHLQSPVLVRYQYWLRDLVTHGFGTTLLGNRPIWPELRRALAVTLQLVIPALILKLVIGIAVGLYAAARHRQRFDRATTAVTLLGFSLPEFWLGLMLQILVTKAFLATGVRVFYATGLTTPGAANVLVDRLQHVTLPVVVLTASGIALVARFTRAAALQVIRAPFVATAHAKGLRPRRILFAHVLRGAVVPLAAVIAIDVGRLFSGTIVVETVFGIDGMGRYFIDALASGDAYAIMAWLTLTAPVVVVANLSADLFHGYIDPRVRHA